MFFSPRSTFGRFFERLPTKDASLKKGEVFPLEWTCPCRGGDVRTLFVGELAHQQKRTCSAEARMSQSIPMGFLLFLFNPKP